MGPRGLSKPEVNSFEDISKIRNRNDKSIVFLTDVDTTLRDFYWRYDRGLEPYDSVTKQPAMAMPAAEGLTDAEKAKYASANLYEVSFINRAKGQMEIGQTVDVIGDENLVTEIGKATQTDSTGKVISIGKYMIVWKKINGKYLIIREMWNDDVKPN